MYVEHSTGVNMKHHEFSFWRGKLQLHTMVNDLAISNLFYYALHVDSVWLTQCIDMNSERMGWASYVTTCTPTDMGGIQDLISERKRFEAITVQNSTQKGVHLRSANSRRCGNVGREGKIH